MQHYPLTFSLAVILFTIGCSNAKKDASPPPVTVSPGVARHWDIGDQILRNKLPDDVSDGYLEFGKSPNSSYGVMLAHERISTRNHERSDLLLYMHTGVARFHIGEKSFTASTGDLLFVPRGAVYTAETLSKRKLELLAVFTPPLDPGDIVYHEAAERVIPTPGGKKLRVQMADTTAPDSTRELTEEEILRMMDYEEVDEWTE